MPQNNIEKWIPIKDYEEFYAISNFGNIKSLEKTWYFGCGRKAKKHQEERILKPTIAANGYLSMKLSKYGKAQTKFIHHLVWEAFGDKPRDGYKLQVDHIDNGRLNNHIDNLQLLKQRDNLIKGVKNRGNEFPIGVSKRNNRYRASIYSNGKKIHLGYYKDPIEAGLVYEQAYGEAI